MGAQLEVKDMRSKFKTTALALITAMSTLMVGQHASAFSDNKPSIEFSLTPFGDLGCNTSREFSPVSQPNGQDALVQLFDANFVAYGVDPYYTDGGLNSFGSEVSAGAVAECLGVTVGDIINFESVGFTQSFADTTFYGFRFELNAPAGGLDVGYHEVAIKEIAAIAPTVTLTSTTTTVIGTTPFSVTATFDQDVTGFSPLTQPGDLVVANGNLTGFTQVSDRVYILNITPSGAGDVSVTVPAAAAQSLAEQDNEVSVPLIIDNTIVADTQRAIAGFMLGRANNLASNQPGLTRFLMGDGCGAFSANTNEVAGAISGCLSQGNAWAELTSSWSGGDSYTLGTFGAHGFVNPNLIIGGMIQFDYAEDSRNNASGTGWMVGPYFVAQVPDQPLYFEGRLLYGQTDNC